MPRNRKNTETEDAPGAPEWMVTFSDCMTLLLTFFVLLLSFSSFDDKVFRRMETALAEALPSVGISTVSNRDAFSPVRQIQYKKDLRKGNEKPTLDGNLEANPKQDINLLPFQNRKVFLIPSDKIFWGRGTVISAKGRKLLSDIASLLRTLPNRIAISENSWQNDANNTDLGLYRAWTVTEYLIKYEALDKNRLSISAASTILCESTSYTQNAFRESGQNRMLEVVILERSAYE